MAIGDLIPARHTRMPALRSDGTQSLLALHHEMNRLFDDFWHDLDLPGLGQERGLGWPSVEVSETDKELKVVAELPGVDEKDVEVLLDNGMLSIRGEKKGESADDARRLSERYYGRFERRIALSAEVQQDKVNATFRNGVLTINLPKSEQTSPHAKRIQISH